MLSLAKARGDLEKFPVNRWRMTRFIRSLVTIRVSRILLAHENCELDSDICPFLSGRLHVERNRRFPQALQSCGLVKSL